MKNTNRVNDLSPQGYIYISPGLVSDDFFLSLGPYLVAWGRLKCGLNVVGSATPRKAKRKVEIDDNGDYFVLFLFVFRFLFFFSPFPTIWFKVVRRESDRGWIEVVRSRVEKGS